MADLLRQLLAAVVARLRALGALVHHWMGLVAIAVVLWMGFIFFWYVFPGWGLG